VLVTCKSFHFSGTLPPSTLNLSTLHPLLHDDGSSVIPFFSD
jgi:hypothetical protein